MALTRRPLLACPLISLAHKAFAAAPVLNLGTINRYGICWVGAQLVVEIFKAASVKMTVNPLPGSRVSKLVVSGELDGDLARPYSYGVTYPQLLRVEPPYYRLSARAFWMSDRKVEVQTTADLSRYSVGIVRGIAFSADLTKHLSTVTLAQESTQMFKMLQAGRVDLVIDSTIGAIPSLEALNLNAVVMSPELARYEVYLYLHARHKDLLPFIGQTIRRMKDSGELELLIAHFEPLAHAEQIEAFVMGPGGAAFSP